MSELRQLASQLPGALLCVCVCVLVRVMGSKRKQKSCVKPEKVEVDSRASRSAAKR